MKPDQLSMTSDCEAKNIDHIRSVHLHRLVCTNTASRQYRSLIVSPGIDDAGVPVRHRASASLNGGVVSTAARLYCESRRIHRNSEKQNAPNCFHIKGPL